MLDASKDKIKLYGNHHTSVLIHLFIGNRYMFSDKYMPNLKKWCEDFARIDFTKKTPRQNDMEIDPPVLNHAFLEELGDKHYSRRSFMKWERIMHSHGATL
jgi:hypothetical protein